MTSPHESSSGSASRRALAYGAVLLALAVLGVVLFFLFAPRIQPLLAAGMRAAVS